jgi:hypothetical protein
VSENSSFMDVEESRIRRTQAFAPAFACSSCRSSGRAGAAVRYISRKVTAARWRLAHPRVLASSVCVRVRR